MAGTPWPTDRPAGAPGMGRVLTPYTRTIPRDGVGEQPFHSSEAGRARRGGVIGSVARGEEVIRSRARRGVRSEASHQSTPFCCRSTGRRLVPVSAYVVISVRRGEYTCRLTAGSGLSLLTWCT